MQARVGRGTRDLKGPKRERKIKDDNRVVAKCKGRFKKLKVQKGRREGDNAEQSRAGHIDDGFTVAGWWAPTFSFQVHTDVALIGLKRFPLPGTVR